MQGAGRFSAAPIQLVFPRTEQQPDPRLAHDRIAYFDDALERWIPLATTIRGNTLPCEFPIPDKVEQGTISPDLVNVVYTPSPAVVPVESQTPSPAEPDVTGAYPWFDQNAQTWDVR